jgi:hypothetical protein
MPHHEKKPVTDPALMSFRPSATLSSKTGGKPENRDTRRRAPINRQR